MKVARAHTHSSQGKSPAPGFDDSPTVVSAKVHFQEINATPEWEGAAQPYADFKGVCYSLG